MLGLLRKLTRPSPPSPPNRRQRPATTEVDRNGRPLRGVTLIETRGRNVWRHRIRHFRAQGFDGEVPCCNPRCGRPTAKGKFWPACDACWFGKAVGGKLRTRFWQAISATSDQQTPHPTTEQARWFRDFMDRVDPGGRASRVGGVYMFRSAAAIADQLVESRHCQRCHGWSVRQGPVHLDACYFPPQIWIGDEVYDAPVEQVPLRILERDFIRSVERWRQVIASGDHDLTSGEQRYFEKMIARAA